jgi:7-carboxy-7-deazaguanine synthase
MIRISEIFGPTIQGEGALIGQPTVFVRTGGCDYRCDWCDTLHAVDSEFRHTWKPMTAEDIFTEVEKLSGNKPLMISLSGGNPAIQPLKPLITLGHGKNYKFALETQGSIAADWFEDLDVLTLSPKPPSSKMKTDWNAFDECLKAANGKPQTALKIVIMDETDYQYARDAAARYPHLPLYLQPANHTPSKDENASVDINGIMSRMRWLVDKIAADQWYNVHLLPQLHVLLWGNLKGV